MVDMQYQALPVAELLKGDEEQALYPDLAPEPEPEAGPDFPDEPACEGRVNDPKLTKGPDGHRGQAEGGFAQPSGHLLEILVPPGAHSQERRGYMDCPDPVLPKHVALPSVLPINSDSCTPRDGADTARGLERIMGELGELIEVLPLENAVEESLPAYLQRLHHPKPLVSQGDVQKARHYDPAERPQSRWRCRWTLISPMDERSVADFMPNEALGNRTDFRNPYIKALNSTREELTKSWDLMVEASPASRLATERQDALSSMHVTEVDDFFPPQRNRFACMPDMPEPCRHPCRDGNDMFPEMAEVRICQPFNDRMTQRHTPRHMEFLATSEGQSPAFARCDDILLKASAHQGKDIVDEDNCSNPGDVFREYTRERFSA